MKEYRLAAWVELRAPYVRTAYRRLLNDVSQRHMTVPELAASSGLRRLEVQNFVELLVTRGQLTERERARRSLRKLFAPVARWCRRTCRAAMQGE